MRLLNLTALLCIGLFAACASPEAAGNTQIDLTIGNDQTSDGGSLAFDADRVDYRITCVGTAPGSFPIPDADTSGTDYNYDDSVDISGAFQIVDGQDPPVWSSVMNLPPGDCVASLSVFRNGAVVCEGAQPFTVIADGTTNIDIALLCSVSAETPDGTADTDGEFQFDVGNECPKIFNLSAHPYVVPATDTGTLIQLIAQDLDATCGDNCDPQTCDDANPPVCTPGPDPGLHTLLQAPVGSFDDATTSLATYTCDPDFPGPIHICAYATDGDLDCDKQRCITVDCPDRCAGVVCDDGNECTAEVCNTSTGLCQAGNAPDGVACSSCNGTCQAGVCDLGTPFTAAQMATIMPFTGVTRAVNQSYFNPYSSTLFFANDTVLHNVSTYKGVGASDTITGTNSGDYLLQSDPLIGPQTVCGVEQFLSGNQGDFAHFASVFVNTIDMTLNGGNSSDVLWANNGNDVIFGGNGNDTLDGGPGNDAIFGDSNNDTITMGPLDGLDLVFGGTGTLDRLAITALRSQILVAPSSASPSFEFDIYYLGEVIAQVIEVERLDLLDGTIDLTACSFGFCNLCGDGTLDGGEECDDGNLTNGDGCAFNCILE